MPMKTRGAAFSDDMPEFGRQMGCMAGIFQIFDRQRLITGRRGGRQAQKSLPPPPASGNTPPKSSSNAPVQSSSTPKIILEKTFSKCTTENSSLSNESSRASSSSSSCSSFSSLDGNKSVQQELPYTSEELFVQRSLKSPPALKGTDMNTKPGHTNVGFRDIVKDSINRDTGGLTVKTSVQEARRNGQYKDSPRPVLLSKSMDGTIVIGIDRSTNVPANVTESSRRFQEQSRFSCDDRRLLRPAETQESKRASTRQKELPRLSLDSRKESLTPSSRLKNSSYKRIDDTLLETLKPQDSPSHRRANSVIAKLMGLEEATVATGVLIAGDYEPSRSPRPVQVTQYEQPSRSPRSTCQDSCVLQPKNESSVLKTKPSPRIVTEAAPWRQQDRGASNFKAPQCRETEVRPRTASIYADIERRLGGLDFLECNKDFRALRILGALHAKDSKEQNDNNVGSVSVQRTGDDLTTSSRNFQPPIVVIKPARATGKPGVSVSSVTPVSGLRSLKRLQPRDLHLAATYETSTTEKNHSRIPKFQSKSEESVCSASSPRPMGSSSPRMAQKKAESERRSRPPVSPRSPSKKSNEAASPRGRTRSKPSQVKSPRDNEALQSTGRKISLVKEVDVSIMDCQKSLAVSSSFGRPSNTAATSSHKGPSILASDSLENIPSPVSVLDTSFYHKRISESFKDGETHTSDECWNSNSLPDTPQSKTSSEVNQIKSENLEVLIQKLEQLQSMNEEAANTQEVMVSVTSNKDHQYIYEILSASGLLHKDYSFTAFPGQLRSSSYPINPELFLILEQTKPEFVSAIQASGAKRSSKPYTGKIHRRLVFDLVNEIIGQKMNIRRPTSQPVKFLQSRKLSGWQLFKDLCTEVDRLQPESSACSDEDEAGCIMLLEDNVLDDWVRFDTEQHEMVLDIERSIFKDLIDEVIGGEATDKLLFGQWKLRRQLSFK